MSLLEIVCYLLVGVVGTAVALTRRPIHQIFTYSFYGMVLALLFFVLHAPDVALSEISVGALLVPLFVLVTMMKTEGKF